jgi:hypothetical protein
VKWLLLRKPEELRAQDAAYRQTLFRLSPPLSSLSALGQDFVRLIRERKSKALLPWLERAKGCPYEELRRFAEAAAERVPSSSSCSRLSPGVLGRSKGRLPGSNCSSVRCMGEPISICYVCGCSMRPDQLMQRNARRLGSERECFQSRLSHCSFRRGEVREVSRIISALPFPAPFILPIIKSLEEKP